MNYYNEFDPKTAAWLRELIKRGAIPDGDVDERSIADVQPSDLRDYTQCHFFAGIGGWSYALQLAGWPKDRPVWTGSCPCQPFSTAGKQLGDKDKRHLWPVFFNLIRECRPQFVFGEQVANAIGKGWLDGVSADLEGAGYACGAAVLGAHSVGSPHIRQRLYWLADAASLRCEQRWATEATALQGGCAERSGAFSGPDQTGQLSRRSEGLCSTGWLADACGERHDGEHALLRPEAGGRSEGALLEAAGRGEDGGLGDTGCTRPQGHGQLGGVSLPQGREGAQRYAGAAGSAWSSFDLIPCADGKTRRIESGLAPLAHGIPARVVRLRGYGNAIVPQCAKIFIEAILDIQK